MSTHTPGPWFQSHRESVYGGYRTEVYTEDGEVVATCAWYPRKLTDTTTTTDREANARLIAAAPQLLNALREMVAELDDACANPRDDWDFYDKARAAIAKATQP